MFSRYSCVIYIYYWLIGVCVDMFSTWCIRGQLFTSFVNKIFNRIALFCKKGYECAKQNETFHDSQQVTCDVANDICVGQLQKPRHPAGSTMMPLPLTGLQIYLRNQPLTSWPLKLITCASRYQNWFIQFQNMYTSLLTDERTASEANASVSLACCRHKITQQQITLVLVTASWKRCYSHLSDITGHIRIPCCVHIHCTAVSQCFTTSLSNRTCATVASCVLLDSLLAASLIDAGLSC